MMKRHKALVLKLITLKMKKLFMPLAVVAMTLSSCSITTKTASTISVNSKLTSETIADLEVDDRRIEYVYRPIGKDRKVMDKTAKTTAVYEALKQGRGDILIAPEYSITKRKGLFGKKIVEVVVSGHVARYKNFRPAE